MWPEAGSHRRISSRRNCGLYRLPGKDRTSTKAFDVRLIEQARKRLGRESAVSSRAQRGHVGLWGAHLSWGQGTVCKDVT